MELQMRNEAGLSWSCLPITLHQDSMERDCREHILPVVRPTWNGSTVVRKKFTEGITNVLLGFYLPGHKDDMVLVRLNGEGTDFVDRRSEIVVMLSLHKAGLIPPVYLELRNGLCYGYTPGRPFSVDDMQDEAMMRRTASTVARLHGVPVPESLQSSEPQLWAKIEQFMRTVSGEYADPLKTQRFKDIFGSCDALSKEIDALKSELPSDSQLVFCHNDLLCGNLIYNEKNEEVSVIDFEYGGGNCAAYDIGNHFCEFAGITEPVDYSRYPSEAVQCKWIRYYLEETAVINDQHPGDVTSDDVVTLYRDVNKYALAAHLFWAVWALLQAANSTIDFDYIEYAAVRFAEYKRRKSRFLRL